MRNVRQIESRKRLVNTKRLEYIIELVLLSGWIRNADPLSLIISSKVGAGKTELVKQYSEVRGVKFLSEATAFGIKSQFLRDIQSGEIKHIVIGDLLVPLSKQKKTREDFIAFFNTIVEDGVKAIHTYAQHWEGKNAVKCGLITTIAETDFLSRSRRWSAMGFLSRAIPLTYGYSPATRIRIYQHIATAENLTELPKKHISLPNRPVHVDQNPRLNLELVGLSMEFEKLEKVYGFRRQEQLQTLLMANALKNGRYRVEEEDLDKITELSDYINLRYKEI
jgi:hypothetical protein